MNASERDEDRSLASAYFSDMIVNQPIPEEMIARYKSRVGFAVDKLGLYMKNLGVTVEDLQGVLNDAPEFFPDNSTHAPGQRTEKDVYQEAIDQIREQSE